MQAITCRLVGQTYWQSVLISPFRPALLCAPSTHALCGRSSKIQRRKLIRCRQPAAHELMGVIQPPASSAPASSANGCKRKRGLCPRPRASPGLQGEPVCTRGSLQVQTNFHHPMLVRANKPEHENPCWDSETEPNRSILTTKMPISSVGDRA